MRGAEAEAMQKERWLALTQLHDAQLDIGCP
jgi:hypothetical protein